MVRGSHYTWILLWVLLATTMALVSAHQILRFRKEAVKCLTLSIGYAAQGKSAFLALEVLKGY
jgi:hypothetical protein